MRYRGIAVEVKSHPNAEPKRAWVVETGGEYTEIRDVSVIHASGPPPGPWKERGEWAQGHLEYEMKLWEEAWAEQTRDKTPVYV
jgi:hypothetical protein